jgi:hypothetical protein
MDDGENKEEKNKITGNVVPLLKAGDKTETQAMNEADKKKRTAGYSTVKHAGNESKNRTSFFLFLNET